MSELVLQALWSGVLTGSSYALIALGLALIFGTMKIINLAHGELVLLAAYIAYTCESAWGASPLLAIPAAIVIVCVATNERYLRTRPGAHPAALPACARGDHATKAPALTNAGAASASTGWTQIPPRPPTEPA